MTSPSLIWPITPERFGSISSPIIRLWHGWLPLTFFPSILLSILPYPPITLYFALFQGLLTEWTFSRIYGDLSWNRLNTKINVKIHPFQSKWSINTFIYYIELIQQATVNKFSCQWCVDVRGAFSHTAASLGLMHFLARINVAFD